MFVRDLENMRVTRGYGFNYIFFPTIYERVLNFSR